MNLVQKLRHRYERNLNFFQKKAPALYNLANLRGKKDVELVISGGQVNLKIGANLIYPQNRSPEEIGRLQAENFLKNPSRLLLPPEMLLSRVDFPSLNHNAMNRIHSSFSSLCGDTFEHDPHFIPFLVTFGLGLGYHLQHLLSLAEVKYLVILEEDIELLKATFYTLDWKKIINYFSQPGRDIFIFVNDSAEALYEDLFQAYQKTHPMFGVYSYVWSIMQNPLFNRVVSLIKEKLILVLRGWGFFDDEFRSLVQTTANALKKVPIFTPQKPVPEKTLAIVVGAGPSLDERIEFLRREQERAVIISCGTAIKTLEREGIVPDFHVNIERPKNVYQVLVDTVSPDFLKNPIMVAGNPNWHEFFDLGRASFMFLKANDAGACLFPKDIPWLYCCNPTVSNAGLAFAVYAGFKHIALVGVDLGTPDPSRHHSLKTAYYDERGPLAGFKGHFDRAVRLPDGSTVFTNSTYLWGQSAIENLIKGRNISVYNLGLGLDFKGTIRLRPEDLSFISSGKEEAVETILQKNLLKNPLTPEAIPKILKQIARDSAFFVQKTREILGVRGLTESRKILLDALCRLYRFTFGEMERRNRAVFLLYKGSAMHFTNIFFVYSYLIPEEKKRQEALEKIREIFFEFLKRSAANVDRLATLSREPQQIFSLEANENFIYILV